MNAQQLDLLDKIIEKTAQTCEQHMLATSSELFLKVVLCEWLLAESHSIIEPRTGKKSAVTVVTLQNSVLSLDTATRQGGAGSVDLRVKEPELSLEIKARAKFGSTEQARYKNYAKDLNNVVHAKAHAFLIAADVEPYRRYTKEVKTKKPRETLEMVLPSAAAVASRTPTDHEGQWGNVKTFARAVRVRCLPTGEEGIIVAVRLG